MSANALECAVNKAFEHYKKAGRASAAKQDNKALRTRAPIDFRGTVAAILDKPSRSIAIECKETALDNFPLNNDKISERCRDELDSEAQLGALTYLVVDFTTLHEVYAVEWSKVQAFIAAPWRASLSIDWFRAHGELVPQSDRENHKKRAAWLLDARPHEFQATAYLKVTREKAAAAGKLVTLFPVELKASKKRAERFASRPAPGTPEHKEYVMGLADQGLKRAMRSGSRTTPGWNPKRRGWGK